MNVSLCKKERQLDGVMSYLFRNLCWEIFKKIQRVLYKDRSHILDLGS